MNRAHPPAADLRPATRIERAEGLIVDRIGDETVMLDPENDRYLRLNATGAVLWDALERAATLAELGDHLAEHADIEPERAAADALAFARDLIDRGAAQIVAD